MPLPITTATRNAMATGHIAHAWLIEITLDGGVIRCWDKPRDGTIGGDVYKGLGDQFEISGQVGAGSDFIAESISFNFDGNQKGVAGHFLNELVNAQWHQRPIKLRGALINTTGDMSLIGYHIEWNGTIDEEKGSEGIGSASILTYTCESGIIRFLSRNMATFTHNDQLRRNATDTFFENTGLKPGQRIPFGISSGVVPGSSGRSGGSPDYVVGSGGGIFDQNAPTVPGWDF